MFDFCLNTLLDELNAYISSKTGLAEERVVYANPKEYHQFLGEKESNQVLMTLVDLFQESLNNRIKTYIPQGNGYITQNQPMAFSMYLLFSTYFKATKALEGLSYLTRVIAFFQSKNFFDQKNTPALQQADLNNISVQLVNLSYEEKSALWSYIGTPYKPSVLYKVGMIAISDTMHLIPEVPVITNFSVRT